jgi:hypothetical protein
MSNKQNPANKSGEPRPLELDDTPEPGDIVDDAERDPATQPRPLSDEDRGTRRPTTP